MLTSSKSSAVMTLTGGALLCAVEGPAPLALFVATDLAGKGEVRLGPPGFARSSAASTKHIKLSRNQLPNLVTGVV